MKILMRFGCVLAMALYLSQGAYSLPEAPKLVKGNESISLDSTLMDILRRPVLIEKIDEKESFVSEAIYAEEVHFLLQTANLFSPGIMSTNSLSDRYVSLSISEAKLFFWSVFHDRDIVGWISYDRFESDDYNGPDMVVIIVQKENADMQDTSLLDSLGQFESSVESVVGRCYSTQCIKGRFKSQDVETEILRSGNFIQMTFYFDGIVKPVTGRFQKLIRKKPERLIESPDEENGVKGVSKGVSPEWR